MPAETDVVVLGAGVAGCAAAYYLARRGLSVRVVEQEAIGSRSSGYALGLLNPTTDFGPPEPLTDVAFNMHRDLWPVLQQESGVDLQTRLAPHLELCLDGMESRDEHERVLRLWAESETDGFSTRWLEPDEVHRLEPRVTPDIRGAVLLESVVFLDSYRFTLALAQAAELHGASFTQGEVTGLRTSGSRVCGVTFTGGEIPCERVVVALGPWAGRAADWLGVDIPVRPQKGQIIHLQGFEQPLRHHIHAHHSLRVGGTCTVVQKPDGMVWVAATREDADFDDATTVEARDTLAQRGTVMVPDLADLGLTEQTACLRPLTPDEQPIVGKAPGWDGVYLSLGAGGKGILLGPAAGQAIADLVLEGETTLPIEPFSPERFAL